MIITLPLNKVTSVL